VRGGSRQGYQVEGGGDLSKVVRESVISSGRVGALP
jgi:hypothetical protein